MTEYRDKIRQAEANATRIVEQLSKLKDETAAYATSTEVVNKVTLRLQNLIISIENLANEQQNYITKLKEIDLSTIVQRIDNLSKKVKTLTNLFIIGIGTTILVNLLVFILILNR